MPADAGKSSKARSARRRGPAVAIVVSRYNASVTDRLRAGALEVVVERLGSAALAEIVEAPGSFELVALSNAAARCGRFRGVAALGCIIKGQTRHDEFIAHAVAGGIAQITVETGVPVAFGVITAETSAQARDRAGGKHGNKGREAMEALLDTIEALAGLESRQRGPTSGPGRSMPDKAIKNRLLRPSARERLAR